MVVVVRLVGRLRKVLGLGLRCGTGPACGEGHLRNVALNSILADL